jgi:acetamidase/formamidase
VPGGGSADGRPSPPLAPETIAWGWSPIDTRPVLTIASGQTVRIDTLAGQGTTQDEEPVAYLGTLGVQPHEVLQDVRDFRASRGARPREGRTGHVLTGPIAIEGAERGDMRSGSGLAPTP